MVNGRSAVGTPPTEDDLGVQFGRAAEAHAARRPELAPRLPPARRRLKEIEDELIKDHLQEVWRRGRALLRAHGLRQSPETLRSTGFDVHQDTEDFRVHQVHGGRQAHRRRAERAVLEDGRRRRARRLLLRAGGGRRPLRRRALPHVAQARVGARAPQDGLLLPPLREGEQAALREALPGAARGTGGAAATTPAVPTTGRRPPPPRRRRRRRRRARRRWRSGRSRWPSSRAASTASGSAGTTATARRARRRSAAPRVRRWRAVGGGANE